MTVERAGVPFLADAEAAGDAEGNAESLDDEGLQDHRIQSKGMVSPALPRIALWVAG